MRIILVYISLFAFANAYSQNRKFLVHLNKAYPFLVEETSGGSSKIDVEDFDRKEISGYFISAANGWIESLELKRLEQDSSLNKICNSAVLKFSSSRFKNKVYWQREQKNFDYALKLAKVPHRRFVSFGIMVDLLDLEKNEKFFFDRRVKTSDLSLYEGVRPKIMNENHPDYVEPVPLEAKSEAQLCQAFLEQMKKSKAFNKLKKGNYSQIGISVRIEEKSLNRSKRPFLYAVVIFSGKQSPKFDQPEKIKLSLSGYDE
ncbi:MAG: hypothetical protein BM555_06710 [Crocinitomix sp. MedPE-SWsnd]|nr:MAG: hypothetical protein BM555_06710 [Crocinitomix sp. MedPE-SWsnd]